ncbi:hypothetical protein VB854_20575 [Limnoraphis robusta CCNP1315]|uniref:Uncharacterized protein n=2 Tax=Limnoraphis TaxID=1332112 RepID=A0ABU5U5A7_9CYAN|nr:hypothetical protein [Limnoraphis robusta]MEA5521338.1 hypothetical protein [Limnoraphis robusta CCNP1315]
MMSHQDFPRTLSHPLSDYKRKTTLKMPKPNFNKNQPKPEEISPIITTTSGKNRIDIEDVKLIKDEENKRIAFRFFPPNDQETAWALALIHCQEPLQIPIPYSIDQPTLEFQHCLQGQMVSCIYLMLKEGWKLKIKPLKTMKVNI